LTDSLNGLSFSALFDAVVDAMLLVDDSGHVALANPAAQQLFGYTQEPLAKLQPTRACK